MFERSFLVMLFYTFVLFTFKILAPEVASSSEGGREGGSLCSQVRHQVRLEDNSKVAGPDSNRGIFWQMTRAAKCECV